MDVRDGTHDSPKYVSDGYPLVTSKNLVNGKIDFSTCTFISKEDHNAISKRSAVEEGDILYAMIGTIGNPVVVEKSHEFSIKNVALFKFNNNNVFNRYIFHFLNSTLAERQFNRNSRGGTQKFVSLGNIRDLQIPLPPLAEQKRIAAILDKADSLRRKNQQAIQLADQFLRAVFLELFGDPVTNPKRWKKEPLENHFKIGTGGTPSRAIQENYGGNIPWVKTTEVCGRLILETGETLTKRGLSDSNCKVYPIGSLIIAMYGQGKTRGQCGILGLEAATNQACAVLEPSETLEMNFVYQYIKYSYDQLRELSRGGNQPNLNLSLVKSFEVMIPDKKLQIHFSNIFFRVQKILKQSQDFKVDNLFNSLSQKAFAGEL